MTLPGWVGVREPWGRLGGRYAKNVTICPTLVCTTPTVSRTRRLGSTHTTPWLVCMLSLCGAERAFLLRRQLSKLHRPGQFAALVAGTGLNIAVTDAARMLAATEKAPHELSALLTAAPLLPDVALGVGTSKRLRSHQKPEHHCEALLCTRLEAEPPGALEALSPLVLYSFRCPCATCSARIAHFARQRPGVRIEVAYERCNRPHRYEPVSKSRPVLGYGRPACALIGRGWPRLAEAGRSSGQPGA